MWKFGVQVTISSHLVFGWTPSGAVKTLPLQTEKLHFAGGKLHNILDFTNCFHCKPKTSEDGPWNFWQEQLQRVVPETDFKFFCSSFKTDSLIWVSANIRNSNPQVILFGQRVDSVFQTTLIPRLWGRMGLLGLGFFQNWHKILLKQQNSCKRNSSGPFQMLKC